MSALSPLETAVDVQRAPMTAKEIAKAISQKHLAYKQAIATGRMQEAQVLLAERQRLEQALRAAQEIEAKLAADRASWLASEECAAAKLREEEELAKRQAADEERKNQIATHAARVGALLVQLDDALDQLWVREQQTPRPDTAPPWLTQESRDEAIFSAASWFMTNRIAGRPASASFLGVRLRLLAHYCLSTQGAAHPY